MPYSNNQIDQMVFTTEDINNHQTRLVTPLVNDLIKCDPAAAPVRIPPANSSEETRQELLQMAAVISTMSDEEQQQMMSQHDEDFSTGFKKILEDNGFTFDFDLIKRMVTESSEIILRFKYKHNRPRPWQLAPVLGINLETKHTYTSKSPSFPSGHAIQSRLIARALIQYFPELEAELLAEADAVADSRTIGGLHFPSDIEYGKLLGDWMGQFIDLGVNESKTIGLQEVEPNQEPNPAQQGEDEDDRLHLIRRFKGKIKDYEQYWNDRISGNN